MKKVLFITYIFPPIGGSGVQRTTKFVKYLPQFGWQPFVVCGNDGDVFRDGYDPSLVDEIPTGARIFRTRFISPLGMRRWMHQKLSRNGIKNPGQALENQADAEKIDNNGLHKNWRILFRILSRPLSPFEFPPIDAALYWAISIVPLCMKIIRNEKIDLIYTTSFPYSDHITGYLLKLITGKPWVADFRDPWSKNPSAGNIGWRWKFDKRAEKRILHFADRIISVTPSYTQGFQQIVPHQPNHEFITIENGYDSFDFENNVENNSTNHNYDKLRISHIGMVYNGTALDFFEAAKRLSQEDQSKLQVHFIGGLPPKEQQWISNNSLAWQMKVTGRVSHAQAIDEMRQSDIVLLLIGSGHHWEGNYPGKLFEYMKCGTPILLVGPEGDASRLLCESGTGCFVEAKMLDDITKALALLVNNPEQFRSQFFHPRKEIIARYDRCFLTSRLADVFSELVP
jgi:glycosyltransferase involved in cell wall biosynthesis